MIRNMRGLMVTGPNSSQIAVIVTVAVVALVSVRNAHSQEDLNSVLSSMEARLAAQEAEIRALQEQLDTFSPHGAYGPDHSSSVVQRLPLVAEVPRPSEKSSGPVEYLPLRFYPDYDSGFIIRAFDPERHPFELKTNAWIQFRHHGFARDVESWTDNAGLTRPIRNRNAWDIERARLTFGGYALDQRLTYFLQLDGDTDGRHTVDFFDYWWAWKLGDRLRVQMGKRKVSASRQWLLGARRTRFVDRPMANDFFRPDRTIGVWLTGRTHDALHYEFMVGNGYQTSNVPNAMTDDKFTFATTIYWDPWGSFGGQIVDYDYSCTPLVRFGHSFVYSPVSDDQLGQPLGESDFLRLTDGTLLGQVGALAPGVTVSNFDIYFYGLDMAAKWRGWSFNTEVFVRWIEDIRGDGALAINDLLQRGFYVEGGRFLIPQKLDVNLRYSQVSGVFDNSSEYAGGVNWYPLDTHKMKCSFDVTVLDGSPLNNTTSDILVGDDGMLFRTQFQAEF